MIILEIRLPWYSIQVSQFMIMSRAYKKLTKLLNIEIWRLSPPNDLTFSRRKKGKFSNKLQEIKCHRILNKEKQNQILKQKTYYMIDVQWNATEKCMNKIIGNAYSPNSRKRFSCTIGYSCLDHSMRFKNRNGWALEYSWVFDIKWHKAERLVILYFLRSRMWFRCGRRYSKMFYFHLN